MSARGVLALMLGLACGALSVARASAQERAAQIDGAAVYRTACAACHGADGKGVSREAAGHAWPLPDFSDCRFASPERSNDWRAIIRHGGPVRSFNTAMPAFVDALSAAEVDAVIVHLRTFCQERRWPVGDLNFPRPLVTEKAFPENEVVLSGFMPTTERDNAESRVTYGRRLGSGGQVEAVLPFPARHLNGEWHSGLGDMEFGYKQLALASARTGTIVSGAARLTVPSGNERYGLGTRLLVFEPSALVGQRLPSGLFAHGQAGFELPLNVPSTPNEVFWRAAGGAVIGAGRDGRTWTPMLELTGHRELEFRDPIRWDLVPQMQVTLSRRQHVAITAGAVVPVGGPSRPTVAKAAITWDWFDGGIFSGWSR